MQGCYFCKKREIELALGTYLSFIITCTVIELTPGPNMGYLAVISASEGRRAGFAATIGIALGLLVVGLATALGAAAVISNSDIAYQALRLGGILYLLYLAWDSWKEEPENSPARVAEQNSRYFKRGLIVNLLNPKATLFYVAILPGFVIDTSSVAVQLTTLTIIYVLVATLIHSTIVMLAGTAQAFLNNAKRRLLTRRIFAVTLMLIAFWFAYETRL
ncbi:MAG: LysE family translocator [Alphaproteobacteria bacterium]|nr:LysE family translocator [Alphaproteobacteria bacterium]